MAAEITGKILVDIACRLIVISSKVCLCMVCLLISVSCYAKEKAIAEYRFKVVIVSCRYLCKAYLINDSSFVCGLIKVVITLLVCNLKTLNDITAFKYRKVVFLCDVIYLRGT